MAALGDYCPGRPVPYHAADEHLPMHGDELFLWKDRGRKWSDLIGRVIEKRFSVCCRLLKRSHRSSRNTILIAAGTAVSMDRGILCTGDAITATTRVIRVAEARRSIRIGLIGINATKVKARMWIFYQGLGFIKESIERNCIYGTYLLPYRSGYSCCSLLAFLSTPFSS